MVSDVGTVCLSPAPGLRCVGLSLTEEVITLVPVGLEVIFSLGLIFAGRDAGRIRFILAAEGPIYLLLTVLGLLGRVVPIFQTSLRAHKILDISIGAASFIPIFLFTFYLYLFKRKEFFPYLPNRFTLVAKAFALIVIPVIIVTNEIGSFLGITYRRVPDPINRVVGNQVPVEPYYASFQFGREFLRSTSLVLLIIYQAVTFLVFFARLVSGIMAQRSIEERAAVEREGVLFRGLGWLVVGMKMSAIETTAGFASISFGIILTRRVLRMIGRACIIIGLVKGLDLQEQFLILDNEYLSGTRKLKMSGMRTNISSPRFVQSSMTQRLSRMASLRPSFVTFPSGRPVSQYTSEFQRAPFGSRYSSGIPLDHTTGTSIAAGAKPRPSPLELYRPSTETTENRVSVVRRHNRAPTLVLNLSPMNLPGGDILAAAMGNSEASTPTIDYVPAPAAVPLSAPVQRSTTPIPWGTRQILSSSPRSESPRPTRLRERPRTQSSWRMLGSSEVPPIPNDLLPASRSKSASRLSYAWPTVELERSVAGPVEAAQGSPSAEAFHAVHARGGSRGQGSNSTAGGISIDWITPESGDTRLGRIKSVGNAPRRTTPHPTSAGAVRSSVALERQEPPTPGASGSGQGVRQGMPRKDSGVLSMDDLARVRRSMPSRR
ncbi:hypothetical protein BC827DRAFT_1271745 [Russula dissimulans]|nr:hypothetical protein BC827DRAFT_1271745 [Russula dissimulans]